MMKPTLIFDYDGTIHDTLRIYEPAFRDTYKMLIRQKLVSEKPVSSNHIAEWLGWNVKDMWNTFQPDLAQKYKEQASARIGRSMVEQIKAHEAVWYPHAKEVLGELKKRGYRMIVLSNCTAEYRKANWTEFDMGQYFLEFYDCESYGFAPKHTIIKKISKKYPGQFIVIGDRKCDLECAKACSGSFVACMYGFSRTGELEGCRKTIKGIRELLNNGIL